MSDIRLNIGASAQVAMVLATMLGLFLLPPARGEMMLISTTGVPIVSILKTALAAGALPVGDGPLPGSLIVFGDRHQVAALALPAGIIPLATPSALCGRGGGKSPWRA